MTKETGGPAFPTNDVCYNGMTLRDYFAAKAMQAPLMQPDRIAQAVKSLGLKESEVLDHVSAASYHFADAMLKAREQ